MRNFRQTSQGDKTEEMLVQNVPQPSKMFPRHACSACAFFMSALSEGPHVPLRLTYIPTHVTGTSLLVLVGGSGFIVLCVTIPE